MKRFGWEVAVTVGGAIVLNVAGWLLDPLKPWWTVHWQWATPVLVLGVCTISLFLRVRVLQQEIASLKAKVSAHDTRMTGLGVPASALSHIQRKALSALLRYQEKHSVKKLIIVRMTGRLHFDNIERSDLKGLEYDLTKEIYGASCVDPERGNELFKEIEDIPDLYLRRNPIAMYGSPLVVCVTDAGRAWVGQGASATPESTGPATA